MFIAKQPQYAKLKEKDELNAIAIRKKHNSITSMCMSCLHSVVLFIIANKKRSHDVNRL